VVQGGCGRCYIAVEPYFVLAEIWHLVLRIFGEAYEVTGVKERRVVRPHVHRGGHGGGGPQHVKGSGEYVAAHIVHPMSI
jgi:hypothetical protein